MLTYFIFDLFIWKHTPRNAEMCRNFSENSRIFRIFSTFSRFFIEKLFCTVSYSDVIHIIRFAIKFHVGLTICGHWERSGENSFIPKTVQKWDFTRVKIAWVNSKSNKPTLKSISKSPDSYKWYWGKVSYENTHAY